MANYTKWFTKKKEKLFITQIEDSKNLINSPSL